MRMWDTRLGAVMAAKGARIGWVAAELGVHRNAVSRWVNGREQLPPARVEQLAALLDVPAEALREAEEART